MGSVILNGLSASVFVLVHSGFNYIYMYKMLHAVHSFIAVNLILTIRFRNQQI